jgi:alanyl-tRNA synthetase
MSRAEVNVTVAGEPMLHGSVLFHLKATHGLPLDVAISRATSKGMTIEWPSFIEEARHNGWWDFQTHDAIRDALVDAEVASTVREQIMLRFRAYVMEHRLLDTLHKYGRN